MEFAWGCGRNSVVPGKEGKMGHRRDRGVGRIGWGIEGPAPPSIPRWYKYEYKATSCRSAERTTQAGQAAHPYHGWTLADAALEANYEKAKEPRDGKGGFRNQTISP